MGQLSPSLPISPEDFHDGMGTCPVLQRHGVVDDNTRSHTPIWQSAPNKLIPHEILFRVFRLVMDDLTRRQPRRVLREDDYWSAVGTNIPSQTFDVSAILLWKASVLDTAWLVLDNIWMVSTVTLHQ